MEVIHMINTYQIPIYKIKASTEYVKMIAGITIELGDKTKK
jgi:hypothetical protein